MCQTDSILFDVQFQLWSSVWTNVLWAQVNQTAVFTASVYSSFLLLFLTILFHVLSSRAEIHVKAYRPSLSYVGIGATKAPVILTSHYNANPVTLVKSLFSLACSNVLLYMCVPPQQDSCINVPRLQSQSQNWETFSGIYFAWISALFSECQKMSPTFTLHYARPRSS